MGQLTQDTRPISISDFSLGKDSLLLTGIDGEELISDLFEFDITVLSEELDIPPEKIIGKTATVTLKGPSSERKINGFINTFTFGEIEDNNLRRYTMKMVPWLWFLKKTNNHRIFQEKNTKDIVSQVFTDLGFTDFVFNAEGGTVREYCVQHNESDFGFVSRLLEEEGIAYYFMHAEDKHTLWLVDQKNAYQECQETGLTYNKGSNTGTHINRWENVHEFRKGQWTLNDYDFKQPLKDLKANNNSISNFIDNSKFEHYEYPGLYVSSLGEKLVNVRLESEEALRNLVYAESDCTSFYAGGRFNMAKHTTASQKGNYIITGMKIKAVENSYFSGQPGESGYSNTFSCIPEDVHFRPALNHKKPTMNGPQSAVVVGPAGEEIYTDDLGRIKVQFIWDREGKSDENSSCFIRVMQTLAGNKWGASFIPRIGHEVIVDFLDGDPDRPLVTGSVYNGKNQPPYSSKTQNGIKTRSTKGGGAQNFNEIRFDDKKGAEQLYIHAEKNQDNIVENNETTQVGNNRVEKVGSNENVSIGGNQIELVGGNKAETIAIAKALSIGAGYQVTVGGAKNQSVGLSSTEQVGIMKHIIAGKRFELVVGESSLVLNSDGTIVLSGKEILVESSNQTTLKGKVVEIN
ncbi:MAG: type VI secretion system tip protein TssI/VgrG [Pseudomonadota bacterium]